MHRQQCLHHDPILNSLVWFHSTEGLPPDIMHDILEGALQYEVKEMLITFTQQKNYFTMGTLQNVVADFRYAYPDVNCPFVLQIINWDKEVKEVY